MSVTTTSHAEGFRIGEAKQKSLAMATRCSMFLAAKWHRYVEREMAVEIARLNHPGVSADFERSRRMC